MPLRVLHSKPPNSHSPLNIIVNSQRPCWRWTGNSTVSTQEAGQQYYSTSSVGDRYLRRRYPEESPPAFAVLDPAVSSQGQPEKGWIELHSPLANTLPFVKGCWGDTANLNHPQGTLIFTHQSDFTYYVTRSPDQINNMSVQVLLVSHNLDSLKALNPPLQLDQIIPIPPEFLNDRSLGAENGLTESCLVHLGGQKVCLILHKYFYSLFFTDEIGEELFDDSGRNKGILRLITFEYEVTPNLDIQCRFCTARNFEYYTKLPNNEYGTITTLASLTKAFVM
ncbi:hypothetical protein M0R45_036329 [Rubus argutus]|uniref:Uncharacterized protein n=1 Tax=Rubus argutus TaxID=59490 RepID=A0AAW1VWM9_RUBAR